MKSRQFGWTIAAIVSLFLALPLAADEPAASQGFDAVQGELPTTMTYDSGWKAGRAATGRIVEQDRDVEMWSLALIGPAALIFLVTVLGLTITVRSLRDDFRRQRSLDHSWRHGAMSRAGRTSRKSHEVFPSA